MLEFLLLYRFGKSIGATARAKGHRAGWYQFLLVAFWFGAEFGTAFALGAVLLLAGERGDHLGPIIYVGAIVGAAFGGWAAFRIVNGLPDLTRNDDFPEEHVAEGSPIGQPEGMPANTSYRPAEMDRGSQPR